MPSKWSKKMFWLVELLILGSAGVLLAQQTAEAPSKLAAEIARLEQLSGGVIGVAAVHLESGERVYHNRDMKFPMASTYKVPIAVQLLHRVDHGELALDSMIVLEPHDLSPGSGTISRLLDDPGVVLSVRNLLELMLLISDNSATDLMLELAGGPAEVNKRMAAINVEGLHIDRSTLKLIADYIGIRDLPAREDYSQDMIREKYKALSEAEREQAEAGFDNDSRDTSTPKAMANLLEKIWQKQILTEESSELLMDIMRRCETGEHRLKGILPPGTVVAHKTGTIGGTANDVGVIELPDDAGHVVTVVFVKESSLPVADRERAIAHVARAVYDYFLFRK